MNGGDEQARGADELSSRDEQTIWADDLKKIGASTNNPETTIIKNTQR